MASERIQSLKILKVGDSRTEEIEDLLAVEEPLEIRIGHGKDREQRSLSVTMRTPGNDLELVTGFLFTEGIIKSIDDIEHIHYCETVKEEEKGNVVRVELNHSVKLDWEKLQRHFYTTSSCGVCGKSSIEAVSQECNYISDPLNIPDSLVKSLPAKLHGHQPVFTYTGGLHASGLFKANGDTLFVREDVGRHNAVDKVIGAMEISRQTEGKILVVSGRASFELVQKSAKANIPVLIAVGAPSNLAVALAASVGMTLIGFAKNDRFNIYSGKERLIR